MGNKVRPDVPVHLSDSYVSTLHSISVHEYRHTEIPLDFRFSLPEFNV
jgi:hypothetical protein